MKKRILTALSVLFSAIFVFSSVMLIIEVTTEKSDIDDYNRLESLTAPTSSDASSSYVNSGSSSSGVDSEVSSMVQAPLRELSELFELNKDFYGWITVEDTQISYPVMYAPNNVNKYLRKNFYGKRSNAGVPYIWEICSPESDNLIIFGHHLKNGTMFSDVAKFVDADYFASHRYITLQTEVGLTRYEIFAAARLEHDDIWYNFTDAADSAEFDSMISYIMNKAVNKTALLPQYGDSIITLSTCTTPSSKTARTVVIAVEI
ncbi:MAG: class B sortase [Clostridia bacterium]|nr:class B sortase [Clostridia bacterium]